MMNEVTLFTLACAAGGVLGYVYFRGLWMTVAVLPRTRHPALLAFMSFGLRTMICILGFYFVSGGQAGRLLAGLLGFLAIRTVVVRYYAGGRKAGAHDKDRLRGNITG